MPSSQVLLHLGSPGMEVWTNPQEVIIMFGQWPALSSPTAKWQLASPMAAIPSIPLKLLLREAAPIIIVDTVPALRVPVGTELGIAAILIAKPFGPAFGVPQRHDLGTRRVAPLGA